MMDTSQRRPCLMLPFAIRCFFLSGQLRRLLLGLRSHCQRLGPPTHKQPQQSEKPFPPRAAAGQITCVVRNRCPPRRRQPCPPCRSGIHELIGQRALFWQPQDHLLRTGPGPCTPGLHVPSLPLRTLPPPARIPTALGSSSLVPEKPSSPSRKPSNPPWSDPAKLSPRPSPLTAAPASHFSPKNRSRQPPFKPRHTFPTR